LNRVKKLCPSNKSAWAEATLPVTFSRRRFPTFNERIKKVADGAADPSAKR
jgi:hypothetical protein